MRVEDITKENIRSADYVCAILLSYDEAESIMHSLMRTNCKGEHLTRSMELEDKLAVLINELREKYKVKMVRTTD